MFSSFRQMVWILNFSIGLSGLARLTAVDELDQSVQALLFALSVGQVPQDDLDDEVHVALRFAAELRPACLDHLFEELENLVVEVAVAGVDVVAEARHQDVEVRTDLFSDGVDDGVEVFDDELVVQSEREVEEVEEQGFEGDLSQRSVRS
jgi:hypothetical protein